MKIKMSARSVAFSIMLGLAGSVDAIELPVIGAIDSGAGAGLLSELPLLGDLIGNELLINSGFPVLSDLPVIGELPLIDGRGIPVVGGLDGTNMLVSGVLLVVAGNPNLNGGLPLIGSGDLGIVDLLLNGGPTLNFLALDAVFPF